MPRHLDQLYVLFSAIVNKFVRLLRLAVPFEEQGKQPKRSLGKYIVVLKVRLNLFILYDFRWKNNSIQTTEKRKLKIHGFWDAQRPCSLQITNAFDHDIK